MEATTFSTLPVEIHVGIARYCKNHDLINLCLVSKLLNQRCLHVLYRYVDLQYGRRDGLAHLHHQIYHLYTEGWSEKDMEREDEIKREMQAEEEQLLEKQHRFLNTLMIHPEYGKHVRLLEETVFVLPILDEKWRLAMQLLTHVQRMDLDFEYFANFPDEQFSAHLFQSVTSVRIVGQIQFSLAKSILNGINPATLNHLCLDLIPDLRIGGPQPRFIPRESGENTRTMAFAVVQGLLTSLTGRFTALRTLILRRIATLDDTVSWNAAAEEASYDEWASFIRSVQGTVEIFMFEQVVDWLYFSPFRGLPSCVKTMDERFQRLVLPTIASGSWSCLEIMELRGIKLSSGQGELEKVLKAVLGENATIVVKEQPDSVQDYQKPYRWN
ncbi:hypothetical protein MMC29_004292 [Sticta canariensis]|nr:hypothetical protein [Sticta canariensis]